MHRNYLKFGILSGNFGTMIVHGDEFKTTHDTDSASYKTAFTSSTGGRLSDPGYLLACLTLTMNFLWLDFYMTNSCVNFVFTSLHSNSQILIEPPVFNGFK